MMVQSVDSSALPQVRAPPGQGSCPDSALLHQRLALFYVNGCFGGPALVNEVASENWELNKIVFSYH